MMPTEQLIVVSTHAALVFEIGRQEPEIWSLRARNGVRGVEGRTEDGRVIRLELALDEPEVVGYDAE